MNRLNELIHELCPNGVKYKKLGEIATITRGGNFQKKDYVEAGIPCIHYGQIYTQYSLFVDRTISFISEEIAKKQKFAVKNDIIMAVTSENIEDVCKCIAWLGESDVAVSGHTAIIHHSINPQYLVYYLHSSMFNKQKTKLAHGTKVIEVTPDKLLDITLPVPPEEIQSEIVRILDNFTELTAELSAKLTTEVTAKKKQYEYYRDSVFPTQNCDSLQIKDIAVTNIGLATSVTKHKTDTGVLLLHNSDIQQNRIVLKQREYITEEFAKKNAKKILQKDDIITVHTGDVGTSAVIDGAYIGAIGFTTITTRIMDKAKVIPQYLCHYLNSQKCKADIAAMTISDRSNLNQSNFEKLSIPVPSLDEQKRIIAFLDKFDDLCSNLSFDLSKESEARQKQYEFYRDKLLTFNHLP